MSEETQDQAAAAAEEPTAVEEQTVAASDNSKKSVSFDHDKLSFDEAQAEIDAIKAKAGQARESLRSSSPAYTSYGSRTSTAVSGYSYDDDAPKSKNMLSHLNTHSAMLNYKVQAARSLVRKQEDLLRNLARMRENMERSENEIGKASDYYSSSRHQPSRGYYERRAESAPFVSRRHQVRELSPVISSTSYVDSFDQKTFEKSYSPVPVSVSSHISAVPAPVSSSEYQPDEEFEREMAAIRKRVANLSRQATEVTTPKYSSYDYSSTLSSSYMPGEGYNDIYTAPEPKLEVKSSKARSYKHVPRSQHTYLPATKTVHTITKHVPVSNGITSYNLPVDTSYSEYLMDTLNYLDGPCAAGSSLVDLYADPLAIGVGDCSLAY